MFGFNLIYLYERADLMHQLLQELDKLHRPRRTSAMFFLFEKMHEVIKVVSEREDDGEGGGGDRIN